MHLKHRIGVEVCCCWLKKPGNKWEAHKRLLAACSTVLRFDGADSAFDADADNADDVILIMARAASCSTMLSIMLVLRWLVRTAALQ